MHFLVKQGFLMVTVFNKDGKKNYYFRAMI